jgi:serine/threonine protein kinase
VAIKIMPAHMAANPVLLARFEQEFNAASRLDHPNIVRALEFDDSGAAPYLVMELVEGESLGQKLEREGRMSETEAIRIIAQVAQGLHRAHKQNLIHRDVKPDNILLRTDGVAKLADLGLVKETETDLNLTRTGRGLGTPHFMAPEQFRNAKGADTRCDIYSLGATLYMMVTGELPFKSNGPLDAWMKKVQNELTAPKDLVPALSDRVNWAILRAMSADRERRPASCREFVEDLIGQSTRQTRSSTVSTTSGQDIWYLIYKDEDNVTHTVKGTTAAIRRSLKDGLLGDADNVRASRSKSGPFDMLRDYPEFRDLIIAAAPMPVPRSSGRLDTTPNHAASEGSTPPPTVVTPTRPAATDVPHISMGVRHDQDRDHSSNITWVTVVILMFVALLSAFIAYRFIPSNWF